ncbi:hypothetical protein GGR92_004454 [Spirosoma lacussanchae]|uniref:DUF3108 domain-containing protein n=1 Tax=Spirosoma lacussanchae TaxID=1884249 RepID=UPI001109909E|nr:hypothetical protein [Spirosoma lacussanchae]
MNYLLLALCLGSFIRCPAQLVPSRQAYETKWAKPETGAMTWYVIRDTAAFELGSVTSQVVDSKDQLTLITTVTMKGMKGTWVDSSICAKATLKPIRHVSYNAQRDMVLDFDRVVTGFYTDKRLGKTTRISDTTRAAYFDSNIYPLLIRWLPLKEGFTQKLAIYDYNPSAKTGVITASVNEVSSSTYTSRKVGTRAVWVVDVTDEISNGKSRYFIDKADRKLWKQTIEAGGRSMMMVAVE